MSTETQGMLRWFDVWSNSAGEPTAVAAPPAESALAAPQGFEQHECRVFALGEEDALSAYARHQNVVKYQLNIKTELAAIARFDDLGGGWFRHHAKDRAIDVEVGELEQKLRVTFYANVPSASSVTGFVLDKRVRMYFNDDIKPSAEEAMLDQVRTWLTCSVEITATKPATTGEPRINSDELPGMWHESDLVGGATDAQPTTFKPQKKHFAEATNQEARDWLIARDPEAAKYWATLPPETNFVQAMGENLRDFGDDEQWYVKFDAIEIHGARESQSGMKELDDTNPTSFTVSGHRVNSGGEPVKEVDRIEYINEFPSLGEAIAFAKIQSALLGVPCYDYVRHVDADGDIIDCRELSGIEPNIIGCETDSDQSPNP